MLAVNGEIYNHRELRRELAGEYDFRTGSDWRVILPLYANTAGRCSTGSTALRLRFYDIERRDEYHLADDNGVIPAYSMGCRRNGAMSHRKLKALYEGVIPPEPGHYRWSREGKTTRWYTRDWFDYEAVEQGRRRPLPRCARRSEAAVRRQLMSDVPYGVLFGADSIRRSSRP